MIISAFFPTGVYSAEPPIRLFRQKGGFELFETLTGPEYVARGFFTSEIHDAIRRESNNFNTGYPYGSFGPTGARFSGQPVKPPTNKYFHSRSPTQNNQTLFDQCKTGRSRKIIVSPVRRSTMEIVYNLGYRPLSQGNYRTDPFSLSQLVPGDPWFKVPGGYMQKRAHHLQRRFETRAYDVSPFAVGWDDNIASQVRSFEKWTPDVYRLITECAASANRKTLDIMTALGELPETVKMFQSLIQRIFKISLEAHKKEFRIWNDVRKSKLRKGFDKDDRGVDEANRRFNRLVVDANNAVAEVHLTWRYGITPLVESLVDLGDSLLEKDVDYFRFREGETVEIPVDYNLPPGWVASKDTVAVKLRAFIKRAYDMNVTVPGYQHYGGNVALMLWELTPRSFMVDWLLPIGDWIASLSTTSSTYEEGATFSWKLEDTITFTHEESNCSVHVTVRDYERVVINPNDYSRLILNPNMTLLRWLDLAAIAWNDFREVAKNSILDYDPKEKYVRKPTNKRRKQ